MRERQRDVINKYDLWNQGETFKCTRTRGHQRKGWRERERERERESHVVRMNKVNKYTQHPNYQKTLCYLL